MVSAAVLAGCAGAPIQETPPPEAFRAACPTLTGLSIQPADYDGVVNNYLACPARVDLEKLHCPGGADTGAQCLSDAQIATVRAVHSPFTLPFPVANGLSQTSCRLRLSWRSARKA